LIFLNNQIAFCWAIICCLKRKNKKTTFSFQSMPNLNFAEDFVQINHFEHEYYYIQIFPFVQPVTAKAHGLCDAA